MSVWKHIAASLKAEGCCALVTVAHVEGSTPREAGARMVVRKDGGFYGTIGGGQLEYEAIRMAKRTLAASDAGFLVQKVSLGPDLGQCCGGRAEIAIECLSQGDLAMAGKLSELESSNRTFATAATFSGGHLAEREVITDLPSTAFCLKPVSDGGHRLIERFGATFRPVYLFGAGHVGKALVLALAPLPFKVVWIDARAEQFPAAVPPNVTMVQSSDVADLLQNAPETAFVLALTHSHALDEEIMARALFLQKFAYCGVIGSRTKRVRFQKRLKSRGMSDTLISKMVCPIGATAIKSKHPAAIAAGVAADLLERDELCLQQNIESQRLAQQ